ncbi:hypothetical protein GCM10010400_19240 [Streptomyces aculeolatus]|nr:hypothetical protein [Streptomyces aculeolatus]
MLEQLALFAPVVGGVLNLAAAGIRFAAAAFAHRHKERGSG